MLPIIPPNDNSPFDTIKQTGERGEYWSARDLQTALGYVEWRKFEDAIERSIAACENSGLAPTDHFVGAAKKVPLGSGAVRSVIDWHLSRYASYLIAMNGDSRKPEIAAAQTYFAVKTREAEAAAEQAPATPALPDLTTPQGVLALAQQFTRTAEQLVEADRRVKELEPKALAHDTLMAAQDGDVLVRQAAKTLGWRESDLRGFLLDEKLIYRRQRTCGGWEYDFYAAHSACFNAVEKVVEHTWGSCAHYTLHVTPRGMSFIQMRMDKRAAAMREALGGAA
ncbi:phage antirepressor KilAC domain-containing protein [Streptomyces sp. NPDC001054]